MCESVENVSIGERERRGDREIKRKRRKESVWSTVREAKHAGGV